MKLKVQWSLWTALYCMALVSTSACAEEVVMSYLFNCNGFYDTALTEAELAAAPKWIETAESPPLSPRQAIKLATEYVSSVPNLGKLWNVKSVSLVPAGFGDWVYVIELRPKPKGDSFGVPPSVKAIVTFDGRVAPIKAAAGPRKE